MTHEYLEHSGSVEYIRIAHVHPRSSILHKGETHQCWDDCVRPADGVVGQDINTNTKTNTIIEYF